MKIAVFASGGGSNFQQLIDRKASGELSAEIALLVGNNSKATCFERARNANIPALHISPAHFETEDEYLEKLLSALQNAKVELIVLAGYMRKLPDGLITAFRNRIVNIHPALLPAFGGQGMYGMNVHKAVKEFGAKITGITIHFVDEEYDHGAIVAQCSVPVYSEDSAEDIATRVLKCEHANYWRAVDAISRGSITVEDGVVRGSID